MHLFGNILIGHLLTFWAAVQFVLILLRISETIRWKWWLVLLPVIVISLVAAAVFLSLHCVEHASHQRIFPGR